VFCAVSALLIAEAAAVSDKVFSLHLLPPLVISKGLVLPRYPISLLDDVMFV
jgi:hypothetical protein